MVTKYSIEFSAEMIFSRMVTVWWYRQLSANGHSCKKTSLVTDTVFNSPSYFPPFPVGIILVSVQLYYRAFISNSWGSTYERVDRIKNYVVYYYMLSFQQFTQVWGCKKCGCLIWKGQYRFLIHFPDNFWAP